MYVFTEKSTKSSEKRVVAQYILTEQRMLEGLLCIKGTHLYILIQLSYITLLPLLTSRFLLRRVFKLIDAFTSL